MHPARHWRRKQPSPATREAVLEALDAESAVSARDLVKEAHLPWRRVCAALDDLMIRGRVEMTEDYKFRKV